MEKTLYELVKPYIESIEWNIQLKYRGIYIWADIKWTDFDFNRISIEFSPVHNNVGETSRVYKIDSSDYVRMGGNKYGFAEFPLLKALKGALENDLITRVNKSIGR